MAQPPVRIRQSIRDHITAETFPFVVKSTKLEETLGYPISLDPEWNMLWKTLEPFYSDSRTFVPTLATVLTAWIDAFISWLEAESNEDNVDNLLEALKSQGRLELELEIAEEKQSRPRPVTKWRPSKNNFVILLPVAEPTGVRTILSGFVGDLLNIFTKSPIINSPAQAVDAAVEEDTDWADLDSISTPTTSSSFYQPALPARSINRLPFIPEDASDPLPTIASI